MRNLISINELEFDCICKLNSLVLDIFNNAYQICRSHLFQQSFVIKFRNTERKDFSYAVALVLVQLHQKFYSISEEAVLSLKSKITPRVWRVFQTFAKNYELECPIFLVQEKGFDLAFPGVRDVKKVQMVCKETADIGVSRMPDMKGTTFACWDEYADW